MPSSVKNIQTIIPNSDKLEEYTIFKWYFHFISLFPYPNIQMYSIEEHQ